MHATHTNDIRTHRYGITPRARVATRVLLATMMLSHSAHAQSATPLPAGTTRGWRVSGGVDESWESNYQFTGLDNKGDASTRAGVEVARLWNAPRSRLTVTAAGSVVRFQTLSELDRNTYDVSLAAHHDFSRRANAQLAVRARSDLFNRGVNALGDGALLARVVSARSNDISGTFAYRWTPDVTAHLLVHGEQVVFDATGFADGRLVVANATLDRRLSRSTTLSMSLEDRHTEVTSSILDVQQLILSSEHTIQSHLSMRFLAGMAFGADVHSSLAQNLYGGATIIVRHPKTGFSFDAQRVIGQEFGRETSGIQVTNRAGVNANRTIARGWQVDGSASHGVTSAVQAAGQSTTSTEGTFNLRYMTRSGPTFSMGTFVRRRADRIAVTSRGITAGFGYSWSTLQGKPAGSPAAGK